MVNGILYVISAPSGAGKTSLVKALIESTEDLVVSVSHTTRPARPGEENGKNYFFVSDAEFSKMVREEKFLEYATVFKHKYGTSRESVECALESGKDVILEIDWQGARQVVESWQGNCMSVFILPPSRDALQDRLISRDQDKSSVIEHRMAKAVEEMSHYNEFNYIIKNDSFNEALADLQAIVRTGNLALQKQSYRLKDLITSLLEV